MPPHSVTEIFLEKLFSGVYLLPENKERISDGKSSFTTASYFSQKQTTFLLDINLAVFLLFSDEKLSLKLPAPSQKTVQCILWASVTAMVCGMTTECHFSNVLTGICLKIARGFKYFYTLFFS